MTLWDTFAGAPLLFVVLTQAIAVSWFYGEFIVSVVSYSKDFYHLRMRVGNVFGHVCLCVCLSVCLSVFLSVQAITFEPLDIETSFLGMQVHLYHI